MKPKFLATLLHWVLHCGLVSIRIPRCGWLPFRFRGASLREFLQGVDIWPKLSQPRRSPRPVQIELSYSQEWYFHPSAHLRVLHVPDGHPIKKGAVSAAAEVLISSFTASVSQWRNARKGRKGEGRPNSVGAYAKSAGSLIAPCTGCFNEGVAIFVKFTGGRGTYSK